MQARLAAIDSPMNDMNFEGVLGFRLNRLVTQPLARLEKSKLPSCGRITGKPEAIHLLEMPAKSATRTNDFSCLQLSDIPVYRPVGLHSVSR
jgi:hypothetical protein